MTKSPTTLDWTAAYRKGADTNRVITKLLAEIKHVGSDACVSKVDVEYRSHLKCNRIRVIHQKLVLLRPIFKDVKWVGLILVPTELRRVIFNHSHAGPSGGHIGEYKTLLRIIMRFF